VTDTPAFADLIDLKRRFIALTDRQKTLADAMPKPTAIVADEAAATAEQRTEWNQVAAELTDLAVQINNHAVFEDVSQMERYQLDKDASKAARVV